MCHGRCIVLQDLRRPRRLPIWKNLTLMGSDLQFIHCIWVDLNEYEDQFFVFIKNRDLIPRDCNFLREEVAFPACVCSIQGITELDWTPMRLETFALLHVDLDAALFGHICRAPGTDDYLCKRSCTAVEISAFINKVLKIANSYKLTSHSSKHTTLGWASSFGIDEPA